METILIIILVLILLGVIPVRRRWTVGGNFLGLLALILLILLILGRI